jgi:hypothetical protein
VDSNSAMTFDGACPLSSAGAVVIGSATGSVGGTVNITAGAWLTAGSATVGRYGAGTLNLTQSSTLTSATNIYLAAYAGSSGTLNVLDPGTAATIGGSLFLGGNETNAGGTALLTIGTGGTVTAATNVTIWTGGTLSLQGGQINTPLYQLRGGTLNTSGPLATPIYSSGGGTFNVTDTNNALILSAALTNAANQTLTKTGPGTLIINGPQSHAPGAAFYATAGVTQFNSDAGGPTGDTPNLSLHATNAGTPGGAVNFGATQHLHLLDIGTNTTVSIDANGQHVVVTDSLAIAGVSSDSNNPGAAGTIDLHNNALVVHNGDLPAIQAAIQAGYHGGDWQGPGITSSMVAAHTNQMTIAVDFAGNIGLTFTDGAATWFGQTISSTNASTDLLVMPTLIGDLNMDGAVNSLDYFALTPNLGKSEMTWGSGDLNGDGDVNALDYFALTPNLGQTVADLSPAFGGAGGNPGAPAIVSATPEPASLTLLGLGGVLLIGRRRR